MNIGERFKMSRKEYEVKDRLGSGGQGTTWLVVDIVSGNEYAYKELKDDNKSRLNNKITNVKSIIRQKLDKRLKQAVDGRGLSGKINFTLPLDYNSNNPGYLMELAHGKSLGYWAYDREIGKNSGKYKNLFPDMTIVDKLILLERAATAFAILHSAGYCYADISWGNLMWDENSNALYIIDCENMASSADIRNGKCDFLKGTRFFMAPEVAFGVREARVSAASDDYALATLIFCTLTNNILDSAYSGKAMDVPCVGMQDVADYEYDNDINPNWRYFVFDPNNTSNNLDGVGVGNSYAHERIEKYVIKVWEKDIDEQLKQLFYKAFNDPFDTASRPAAKIWASTIRNIIAGNKPPKKKTTSGNKNKASTEKKPTHSVVAEGGAKTSAKKYPPFKPTGSGSSGSRKKYPEFKPSNRGGGAVTKYKKFTPRQDMPNKEI